MLVHLIVQNFAVSCALAILTSSLRIAIKNCRREVDEEKTSLLKTRQNF